MSKVRLGWGAYSGLNWSRLKNLDNRVEAIAPDTQGCSDTGYVQASARGCHPLRWQIITQDESKIFPIVRFNRFLQASWCGANRRWTRGKETLTCDLCFCPERSRYMISRRHGAQFASNYSAACLSKNPEKPGVYQLPKKTSLICSA